MRILIISLLFVVNLFARCGCIDASAATLFEDQAVNYYKNLDNELAKKIKNVNDVFNKIEELTNTEIYEITKSNKKQQINFDSIIFTLEQRQMINHIIQITK